ncbi:MAG: helix-turn-helix domain-containing protein [Hyphomicrobiaceae bacterium]
MNETPCLQGLLMRALLSELQETQSQVLTLGRFSAIERVAQFLHILTQSLEPDSDGAFEFPMNRRDMADYLGLTIETVSRIINRLKRAGKIRLLGSNRFVIPDEDEFVDELLATAS